MMREKIKNETQFHGYLDGSQVSHINKTEALIHMRSASESEISLSASICEVLNETSMKTLTELKM